MHAMDMPSIRPRHRIAVRIISASCIAMVVALLLIGGTLLLSWQLEGAAAAINDAGSLRMRAYRVALTVPPVSRETAARARDEIAAMDRALAGLERGDPARPLLLPGDTGIRERFGAVQARWRTAMRPQALAAAAATDAAAHSAAAAYRRQLDAYVTAADGLVRAIERDNARKTVWLRLSQSTLIAIAVAGTVAMIYLLYLWIIRPLLQLQHGIERMTARDFLVRLPVESRDEFGLLARGFNAMADEIQGVYRDLEQRVEHKTAELAEQNRQLAMLYDMAAFLHIPNSIEDTCRGFLQRLIRQYRADGGSLRVLDPSGERLHLIVSEGLSPELKDREHCMHANECLCGTTTVQGATVVRDFRRLPRHQVYRCEDEGFTGIAIFQIVAPQAVLGSFALHFREEPRLSTAERQLLETLGQHLGVALQNFRLSAKERQLAVAEERNLMAQGLHDSIAQGLNFIHLQTQLLEDALRRDRLDDARETLALLKTGVGESYQDVRELLLNFRSKLGNGELNGSVIETVNRFTHQTGIEVDLDIDGDGAPLPPEQQLQVLFILQEALSNIRKHAAAHRVEVRLSNERDFRLSVTDDGRGFDPTAAQADRHVGLAIMRERAGRMDAELDIDSRPGEGTRLQLRLDQHRRVAA